MTVLKRFLMVSVILWWKIRSCQNSIPSSSEPLRVQYVEESPDQFWDRAQCLYCWWDSDLPSSALQIAHSKVLSCCTVTVDSAASWWYSVIERSQKHGESHGLKDVLDYRRQTLTLFNWSIQRQKIKVTTVWASSWKHPWQCVVLLWHISLQGNNTVGTHTGFQNAFHFFLYYSWVLENVCQNIFRDGNINFTY